MQDKQLLTCKPACASKVCEAHSKRRARQPSYALCLGEDAGHGLISGKASLQPKMACRHGSGGDAVMPEDA